MSEIQDSQRYKELVAAVRELREAENKLVLCKRRVDELSGVIPENSQYKNRKKTISAKEFRAGCQV